MKPSLIAEALELCVRIARPAFVKGPPGVGKSAVVRQVAKSLGYDLRDVRAVLLDPVDLRGLPHVNGDGRSHWAVPEFLPRDGKGILFLDELDRAPQLVQNACLQLILDRQLGEYTLPAGWTCIAAGNGDTDRGTSRMSSALGTRFVSHLEYEIDLDDWSRYALSADYRLEVVAFLRFRPQLLHAYDRNASTFPCPRTWQWVSEILDATPSVGIEHELYAGAVGPGAAAEFLGFLRTYRQMPSLDAILLDPMGAHIPTEISARYAVAAGLARKATENNFSSVVQYADRLPEEFSVLCISAATRRTPAVQHTRAYIDWAARHSATLI